MSCVAGVGIGVFCTHNFYVLLGVIQMRRWAGGGGGSSQVLNSYLPINYVGMDLRYWPLALYGRHRLIIQFFLTWAC